MYVKYFCQVSIGLNKRWRKRQLFQDRLFLAFFILSRKNCRFDLHSLYRKTFILSQSNSVQNLSSLTLKTKELWRGVENTPPGPTPAKKARC